MSKCDCTKLDDNIQCAECYTSQAWTSSFEGPVEPANDRVHPFFPTTIFRIDHLPPSTPDASNNCSLKGTFGLDVGLPGLNSNLYVEDVATPNNPFRFGGRGFIDGGGGGVGVGIDLIFTDLDGLYCPPDYGNMNPGEEYDWRVFYNRDALWGHFDVTHGGITTNTGEPFLVHRPSMGTNVFGYYAVNRAGYVNKDFQKKLTVTYSFDRLGQSIDSEPISKNGFWGVNYVHDPCPQVHNYALANGVARAFVPHGNTILKQTIHPIGAHINLFCFTRASFDRREHDPLTFTFRDARGDIHSYWDQVFTTERDRPVWLVYNYHPDGPLDANKILEIGQNAFPTGVTVGDIIPGTIDLSHTVTVTDNFGDNDLEYDLHIEVPAFTFDETITGLRKKVGLCENGVVTVSVPTHQFRRPYPGFLDFGWGGVVFGTSASNAGIVDVDPFPVPFARTRFSSAGPEHIDELIHNGTPDLHKHKYWFTGIGTIVVDGDPPAEAGFVLDKVVWNRVTGDPLVITARDTFNEPTIPNNYTFDVDTTESGDTMDMFFHNYGEKTSSVSNVVITGSGGVMTAVDHTSDTFLPYQGKLFKVTGPTGPVGAGAQNTITFTHDVNGKLLPSPFTFIVKATNGGT